MLKADIRREMRALSRCGYLPAQDYSAALGETLVQEAIGREGKIQSGELALRDSFGKVLPLSIVVRGFY